MRRISKLWIVFFLSALLIISLPAIVKAEEWAVYGNATNVSYPDRGINCSYGSVHPNQSCYWCWVNFSTKHMDHSFFSYEAMDDYYTSGDSLIIEPGDTYTLSAFQDQDTTITTTSEPSMLSGIILFIQGLFV